MFQAKQFYLEQLKDGPTSHRTITKRMTGKFDVGAASVCDELLKEGRIVAESYSLIKGTNKRNIVYRLTDHAHAKVEDLDRWPCGQVKSKGNAFDWRNKEQSIFSKREVVIAQQVYHNHSQITIYSRA